MREGERELMQKHYFVKTHFHVNTFRFALNECVSWCHPESLFTETVPNYHLPKGWPALESKPKLSAKPLKVDISSHCQSPVAPKPVPQETKVTRETCERVQNQTTNPCVTHSEYWKRSEGNAPVLRKIFILSDRRSHYGLIGNETHPCGIVLRKIFEVSRSSKAVFIWPSEVWKRMALIRAGRNGLWEGEREDSAF